MYIAARCPRCLVTVYTTYVKDDTQGFGVMSLADEDLPFYNCPLPICEYHIPTFHYVNFYPNPTKTMKASMSPGFRVVPRTSETRPFRTPSQVARLDITHALPESDAQELSPLGPPRAVMASQVADEAQAANQATANQETANEQTVGGQTVKQQALKEHTSQNIGHANNQGGAAAQPQTPTVRKTPMPLLMIMNSD
jgi:hypothetical protein